MERKISNGNSFINKTNLNSRVSVLFFMLALIFSSTTTATTISCLDATKCHSFDKADSGHQKYSMMFEGKTKVPQEWAKRFLGGPGSSPPQCTSKCGNCTPCRPVHVTVPPGTPVTAEYYPEAWRCKCGNKLNMP